MNDPWVYRCFDADDQLLYVGITNCGLRRLTGGHGKQASWWHLVERVEVAHFASSDEAREAERKAIRDEDPAYNVHGVKPRSLPQWDKYRPTVYFLALDKLAEWLDVPERWVHLQYRNGLPSWRIAKEGPFFKAPEVLNWLQEHDIRLPAQTNEANGERAA